MHPIRLINGPMDGQTTDYAGQRLLRIAIVDLERRPQPIHGEATYEPNGNGTLAFWLGNRWPETLRGVGRFDE